MRRDGIRRLEVSEPDGYGVGSVGRRVSVRPRSAHHEGHLLLVGSAASTHGLLHPARGVFVDGQALFAAGQDGRAARSSQRDGGLIALHEDYPFHGHALRFVFTNEGGEVVTNGEQAQRRARRDGLVADRAIFPADNLFPLAGQHGVAGAAQGGSTATMVSRDIQAGNLVQNCRDVQLRKISLRGAENRNSRVGRSPDVRIGGAEERSRQGDACGGCEVRDAAIVADEQGAARKNGPQLGAAGDSPRNMVRSPAKARKSPSCVESLSPPTMRKWAAGCDFLRSHRDGASYRGASFCAPSAAWM